MKLSRFNLFTTFIVQLLSLLLIKQVIATDYYASPKGSGSTCSQASPCLINSAWSSINEGDTLYLLNGEYTGVNSMITPPKNLSGSASSPITIKALNDGAVTINGQYNNKPIKLSSNNYFIIEGFNAHSSVEGVVELSSSNNNIVRRIVAWDARSNASENLNYSVFGSYYGSDNLFEDVAGWGTGRKIFALYGDTRTTFRRCFFRQTGWEATTAKWQIGLTIGYVSDSTTVENCIGTWDRRTGEMDWGQHYAIFGSDNYGATGTIKVYGNIGYYLNNQIGPFSTMLSASTDYTDVNIKDTVMYTEYAAMDSLAITSHDCDYCTSIGGRGFTGSGSITNHLIDPSVSSLGGNILQHSSEIRPSTGAWIKNKYIDGVLTNDPLWPWPMNNRIMDAMFYSGYDQKGGVNGLGGLDVTKTVFELGGGTMPGSMQTSTACSDGIDNDGDGFTDMNDSSCTFPSDNDESNDDVSPNPPTWP